jgi:hypothetical protein
MPISPAQLSPAVSHRPLATQYIYAHCRASHVHHMRKLGARSPPPPPPQRRRRRPPARRHRRQSSALAYSAAERRSGSGALQPFRPANPNTELSTRRKDKSIQHKSIFMGVGSTYRCFPFIFDRLGLGGLDGAVEHCLGGPVQTASHAGQSSARPNRRQEKTLRQRSAQLHHSTHPSCASRASFRRMFCAPPSPVRPTAPARPRL